MKLDEIKKIIQTAETSEVNVALSKNFRIIKILSGKVTKDGYEVIQPIYILGCLK